MAQLNGPKLAVSLQAMAGQRIQISRGDALVRSRSLERVTKPHDPGRGAHIFLAESVSPFAGAVRKAGRHPRGVSLARMRADLLAVAAPEVEDCLSGCAPLRLPIARAPFGIVAPRSGSQAPRSLDATACSRTYRRVR